MSQAGEEYSDVEESEADIRLGMVELVQEKNRETFNALLEQYARAFWVHGRKYERRIHGQSE